MTAKELLAFLRAFYRDKLTIRQRHVAVARYVPHYDFNNTYQYVICREDVQLNWLRDAITDMGGQTEDVSEPDVKPDGKPDKAQFALIEGDRDAAQSFVTKWRPQVEAMPNARHRSMLLVILGEAMEHKRFFEQAAAGFEDLLGRRTAGAERVGGVLPTRWLE